MDKTGWLSDKELKEVYELLPKERLIDILIEKHKELRKMPQPSYIKDDPKTEPMEQERERKNILFCELHGINYEPPQPKDYISTRDLKELDKAREEKQ